MKIIRYDNYLSQLFRQVSSQDWLQQTFEIWIIFEVSILGWRKKKNESLTKYINRRF